MRKPLDKMPMVPVGDHPGAFGTRRKHDVHTGVDLYVLEGSRVYAIESGTVVNADWFTGARAGCPWWNDTRAVFVEGASGVVCYGEILETFGMAVGASVKEGQLIGIVIRVLKKDKGLPMSMLHMELYESGYRGSGEIWKPGKMPGQLRDVTSLLEG